MRETAPACCARAASDHAAAAPPSATSNSRRPMVTVIRPSRARCVGNGTTPRACSLHVREGGDAAAFRFGPSMTADVPAELAPKLRDCEIDLNAAFAQVRPAVQRREAITEAMRVHQRVLRTLRPALITSPEVKPHTWSPEPVEPEPAMLPAAASRCGRAVVGGSDGEKGSPDCTAATSTETGRFGELRRPPPVGTGRFDLAQCRAAHRIYPHRQPCAGRVQGGGTVGGYDELPHRGITSGTLQH